MNECISTITLNALVYFDLFAESVCLLNRPREQLLSDFRGFGIVEVPHMLHTKCTRLEDFHFG